MTEENKTDSIEVNEVRVHQEQNWKLMTVLQIPWHHVEKLGEEDRKFSGSGGAPSKATSRADGNAKKNDGTTVCLAESNH